MIQNHLSSFQQGAPDAGSSILYSAISDLDIGEVAIPAFTVPGGVDQETVNALLQLPTEAAMPSSDPWAIGASEGAAAIYPAAIPAGLNGQSASQLSVEAAIRGGSKYEEQAEALIDSEDHAEQAQNSAAVQQAVADAQSQEAEETAETEALIATTFSHIKCDHDAPANVAASLKAQEDAAYLVAFGD